ncbi:MAG TPA: ATP-binding cassette domain-containing protein, partial [Bacteroidia bacterium]
MIIAKDIHKSYGHLEVLKGVSLEVKKGEIVSIVGASGAGKTTLLQILGTLDRADKGEIKINETNILALSEKKLSAFRNKQIGFVFQFHHLLPEFSAIENICLPAFIAGVNKIKAEEKAKELLSFLGLSERGHHKPAELS